MEDLLTLNPEHEIKLKRNFYKCLDEGMPKDKAFREMYRLFFKEMDEENEKEEE
jgi:hypothetical protein